MASRLAMHHRTWLWILLALAVVACGSSKEMRAPARGDAGSSPLSLTVDTASPVVGAPSRGRDPAVLALAVAGERPCTGTLLGSNLVLTAHACIVGREPSTLLLYAGDDPSAQEPVARGREIVPSGDATLALVILDGDVPEVTPVPLRDELPQRAERIRTVSFGQRGDEPLVKLVREHVAVIDVVEDRFQVAEAACQGDAGGSALDEGTSEVLGIVTQSGIGCEGPVAYTRIDRHRALIEGAMARAKQMRLEDRDDAGAAPPRAKSPKKSKPPTDVGQPCQAAFECTTGFCVREDEQQAYCSRSCGSGDRCLAGFRCKEATSVKACILSQTEP